MDVHTYWSQKYRLNLETTMENPVAKDISTIFKSSQLAILPAMNDILWSIVTGKRIILVKEMEQYLQLMKSLPPLVSVVVWDVINDRIDESTIKLAQATSREEFDRYDLIRCVVAADPEHPPLDLAKSLVDELLENTGVAK